MAKHAVRPFCELTFIYYTQVWKNTLRSFEQFLRYQFFLQDPQQFLQISGISLLLNLNIKKMIKFIKTF